MLPPFGASPVFYLLGYCAGVSAFAWLAKRRGISTVGVWSVALVGLFGGLIGANLAQLIASGGKEAGKTVLGGIIGGYLSVHLFKRRIGLVRPLGDLFALALSAGEAVGRWGCFFGGCCYGRETGQNGVVVGASTLARRGTRRRYTFRSPRRRFLLCFWFWRNAAHSPRTVCFSSRAFSPVPHGSRSSIIAPRPLSYSV
jgi:prolipoprotein diacylglyceryltransferase